MKGPRPTGLCWYQARRLIQTPVSSCVSPEKGVVSPKQGQARQEGEEDLALDYGQGNRTEVTPSSMQTPSPVCRVHTESTAACTRHTLHTPHPPPWSRARARDGAGLFPTHSQLDTSTVPTLCCQGCSPRASTPLAVGPPAAGKVTVLGGQSFSPAEMPRLPSPPVLHPVEVLFGSEAPEHALSQGVFCQAPTGPAHGLGLFASQGWSQVRNWKGLVRAP